MPTFLQSFLNLLFPLRCVICAKSLEADNKRHLCLGCWNKIRLVKEPICSKCGRYSTVSPCSDCRIRGFRFSKARSAGIYDGVLRECIHLLKYNRKTYLAKPLANLMVSSSGSDSFLKGCDFIVPVPLYPRKEREREFNQSELLAREVGRIVAIPLSIGNLRKVKSTPSQTKLKQKERLENVKGVFRVKNPALFSGKCLLLIDDLFTTGATVNECSKVLLKSGVREVRVLTIARTQ